MQFDITHTPVGSSKGVLDCLEAPLDVPFRFPLLSSLRSASHSAQPVFALVVDIRVAAVAIFREPSSCFCSTWGPPCGPLQLKGRRRLLAST